MSFLFSKQPQKEFPLAQKKFLKWEDDYIWHHEGHSIESVNLPGESGRGKSLWFGPKQLHNTAQNENSHSCVVARRKLQIFAQFCTLCDLADLSVTSTSLRIHTETRRDLSTDRQWVPRAKQEHWGKNNHKGENGQKDSAASISQL